MIRVMYRWTVKQEDREEFVRTWGEGTLKIQTHCSGAMGSILLHSSENPEHFFGMARWPSKEIWEAAQRTMPFLDLQGPKPESEYFFDELIDIIPSSSIKDGSVSRPVRISVVRLDPPYLESKASYDGFRILPARFASNTLENTPASGVTG